MNVNCSAVRAIPSTGPISDFEQIGIHITSSYTRNARAQCPQCARLHNNRNKTLSADIQRGLFQCFRCGWKGKVNGFQSFIEREPDPTALATQKSKRQYAIDKVLSNSVPITDSTAHIARTYINRRMGRILNKDEYPNIRFNPACRYYHDGKCQGFYPALIGEIKDITGRLVTLHRTYLTEDGFKAPLDPVRKIMGVPEGSCTGAAIHLAEATTELALAEGIESALGFSLHLQQPAWACISAHGLQKVVIPKTVKQICIGADNDSSGIQAANALANRLWKQGFIVYIHTPKRPGADWADVIKGGSNARQRKSR